MSSRITVDVRAAVPPYEQIRAQVTALVRTGELVQGARLPAIRALAADLGVAPGTVARAYAELEAAGLVARRRRTGTVVTGGAPSAPPADVRQAAAALVGRARAAGVDDDTLLDVVRTALHSPAPT